MATSTAPSTVAIPEPGDTPEGILQATLALKKNIELAHGFNATINRSKPRVAPTATNIATNAALRRVQGTYP